MAKQTLWDERTLEAVYSYIRRVYQGEFDKNEGIDRAVQLTNRNKSSIAYQFTAFENMIKGKSFVMTLKTLNFEIFLRHIEKEFDRKCLVNALIALKGHLVARGDWGKVGEKEMLTRRYSLRNKIDIDKI